MQITEPKVDYETTSLKKIHLILPTADCCLTFILLLSVPITIFFP